MAKNNKARAVAKVQNPLPIPTTCPYCGGEVHMINNKSIYGRSYGYWPYAYACSDCDAYVGVHPDTDIPLGTLADKRTREARKKAKKPFIDWVKRGEVSRGAAYAMLAKQMDIAKEQCHFGWFNYDQCKQAEEALAVLLGGVCNS